MVLSVQKEGCLYNNLQSKKNHGLLPSSDRLESERMSTDTLLRARAGRSESAVRQDTRALVRQCQKITLEALSKGLDQTLTLMDDALFAQAEKARDGTQQALYLETMQNIRRKRSTITLPFYQHMAEAFRQFPPGPPPEEEQTVQQMSVDIYSAGLLDTETHERMVVVANLTNRTKERCKEALFALEQRLVVVNNGHALTENNNPLSPQYIVESFLQAIEPAALTDAMTVDIYRLFDEMVMKTIGCGVSGD